MSTDPSTTALLTIAQRAALGHVRCAASGQQAASVRRIGAVLQRAPIDCDIAAVLDAIGSRGGIALNFHPDRLVADGRMVSETMVEDGVYRSQFETQISNGGLSAFRGGDRDLWEERLFGGAYQGAVVTPEERPKYGGLNLMDHPDGPCPRFGSCHLRLRPGVVQRSTFCFGDSRLGPRDIGTLDTFEPVLAALLEAADEHGSTLGRPGSVEALIEILLGAHQPVGSPMASHGRALDDYIEVQVHGPVRLADDAEAIVADPSFRSTAIADVFTAIAARYGLDLHWHRGFELEAADVPPEFRGPAIPVIAERIAREFGDGSGRLHAEILGRAARSVVTDPRRWLDWGTPLETLQHIKQLWHVLVRYGD